MNSRNCHFIVQRILIKIDVVVSRIMASQWCKWPITGNLYICTMLHGKWGLRIQMEWRCSSVKEITLDYPIQQAHGNPRSPENFRREAEGESESERDLKMLWCWSWRWRRAAVKGWWQPVKARKGEETVLPWSLPKECGSVRIPRLTPETLFRLLTFRT